MPNNPSLQPFEDICSKINNLQLVLGNLDSSMQSFETICTEIEAINTPFPSHISNDLNNFYSGLKEVSSIIQELDKITLDKLKAILTGASNGIQTLIAPIPAIIADVTSITSLFPKIQSKLSILFDSSKGVDATIGRFNSKLASWSNAPTENSGSNFGTGVLNAIDSGLQKAIAENISLNHKYDTEINSIIGQMNKIAGDLDNPISNLSSDGQKLQTLLDNVNAYLTKYYSILNSVDDLSKRVDKVVALLDQFKPNVDLVYGIVQPLGWFIELIQSKTSRKTVPLEFDVSIRENRLNHYANAIPTNNSKFQVFEQMIYSYFQSNNIGQKIGAVSKNILPITDLKTAADSLNSDLKDLESNGSILNLQSTFSNIDMEIGKVETELKKLSTNAERSHGTVTFQRVHPNVDVTLLKGTSVKTKEGVVFITTENALIKAGAFNTGAIKAVAQAIGTSGNVRANSISIFVSTPVKQSDNTYENEPNPVYEDTFSVSTSSAFTGGTDLSVSEIQGQANDLASKMLAN